MNGKVNGRNVVSAWIEGQFRGKLRGKEQRFVWTLIACLRFADPMDECYCKQKFSQIRSRWSYSEIVKFLKR